ncbi:hypothetical protein LEMLEM_LOCUS1439 [Lemmus lemmus]
MGVQAPPEGEEVFGPRLYGRGETRPRPSAAAAGSGPLTQGPASLQERPEDRSTGGALNRPGSLVAACCVIAEPHCEQRKYLFMRQQESG